jgi:PiT family inorganic phosphate transporter
MTLAGAYAYFALGHGNWVLAFAAFVGAYMAMNIGANDVANNVGPAVGSKAMSLGWAVLLAAVFEAAGALIAGGEVVSTIKNGIIDPARIDDPATFVWLMAAALLAGALWLNFATWVGAPVSTTHSIVGGVLGAGVAAAGADIVNWPKMGEIAASWVISPVLGGLFAAGFLLLIKRTILFQEDRLAAARRMVPLLLAVMAWAFVTYLVMKGLQALVKVDFWTAFLIGAVAGLAVWFLSRPWVANQADFQENTRRGVNHLFTIPLIVAAAFLSFAHGANDVANAVGPLAAIADSVMHSGIPTKAPIPFWVMMVGALGISIGLLLYGPKLIRTVGAEITELDESRAFCVAMAAALTVIVASKLGLPVSSTHIALGGVFGVGFLREYLKKRYASMLHEIMDRHTGLENERLRRFLVHFGKASVDDMEAMLRQVKKADDHFGLSKKERKRLKKIYREKLVKRSVLNKIVAAWLITVPASAFLAGLLFFVLRDFPVHF